MELRRARIVWRHSRTWANFALALRGGKCWYSRWIYNPDTLLRTGLLDYYAAPLIPQGTPTDRQSMGSGVFGMKMLFDRCDGRVTSGSLQLGLHIAATYRVFHRFFMLFRRPPGCVRVNAHWHFKGFCAFLTTLPSDETGLTHQIDTLTKQQRFTDLTMLVTGLPGLSPTSLLVSFVPSGRLSESAECRCWRCLQKPVEPPSWSHKSERMMLLF